MSGREHGGDPEALERAFGKPKEGWLDLSTGINRQGYPVPPLSTDDWRDLPSARLLEDLRDVARHYYRVPTHAAVVAASGSQAIIQWLPRLRLHGRVKVLGPTYGEHAAAWRAGGHAVAEVAGFEMLAEGADVAVVVNPNNPDGRRIEPASLMTVAERLAARGGMLVVDEAFADVASGLGLGPFLGMPGLVVLRSLGKFFGCAGARLGFALAGEKMATDLEAALGPWPISTPAARLGLAALGDQAWIDGTRRRLTEQALSLDRLLVGAGLRLVGGTDLFRLVETPSAERIFEGLARSGICIRRFRDCPTWLRFGLPGAPAEWKRLEAALAALTRASEKR